MRGPGKALGLVAGVVLVLAGAGRSPALEPQPISDAWMAQFEATLTVAAELRHSYDFSGTSTQQPFTKRKGGFFEGLVFLSEEFFRQENDRKQLAFRATLGLWGLADPGNEDLARYFDGRSEHGYDGDIAIDELWAGVAIHPGGWLQVGIQHFKSDHAGLIYNDSDRGIVYHGQTETGFEWNAAYFAKTFDDAVSQLNTENGRPWHVMILNVGIPVGDGEDVKVQVLPSFHYSIDRTGPVETDVGYIGVSAAGKVGGFAMLAAYYWAFGEQTGGMVNPAEQTIDAHQALLDIGYPLREGRVFPHVGVFFATGDDDPLDGRARGFDAIYDYVSAWGFNHFIIRNRINLGPGSLARANSGLFTFRDYDEPANFVNPGILAFNVGLVVEWHERFVTDANIGPAILPHADVPELVLGKDVGNDVGLAINASGKYRIVFDPPKEKGQAPNERVILLGGLAAFIPDEGAIDIFGDHRTAFNALLALVVRI